MTNNEQKWCCSSCCSHWMEFFRYRHLWSRFSSFERKLWSLDVICVTRLSSFRCPLFLFDPAGKSLLLSSCATLMASQFQWCREKNLIILTRLAVRQFIFGSNKRWNGDPRFATSAEANPEACLNRWRFRRPSYWGGRLLLASQGGLWMRHGTGRRKEELRDRKSVV